MQAIITVLFTYNNSYEAPIELQLDNKDTIVGNNNFMF